MQTWENFLRSKKISPEAFAAKQPQAYHQLAAEYELLGEKAFYQRYLFYINAWRKAFSLHD